MHFGSFMPLRSIWDKGLETLAKDFPDHRFSLGLKPDSPEVSDLDLMLAGNLPRDAYLASSKLKGIFSPSPASITCPWLNCASGAFK